MTRSRPTAFTLVELLVVITIIGVLVALLLPAVQSAREAARRVQCKNHVKQLALAAITHQEQIGHFPTGGWRRTWVGDKDRGFGRKQPGGWAFNILPFVEESNLYDLAGDALPHEITDKQREGARRLMATPVSIINCPSRRASVAYPHWHVYTGRERNQRYGLYSDVVNAHVPELVGKLDYAVNAGERMDHGNPGPSSLEDFPSWYESGRLTDVLGNPVVFLDEHDLEGWRNPLVGDLGFNGISFRISEVGVRHVTDGTSNTYLIGEKFIHPILYETGPDYFFDDPYNRTRTRGDQLAWCTGHGSNITRIASKPPRRDSNEGVTTNESPYNAWVFGSVHTAGFHMAFCDGSVRVIDYAIDLRAHMAGANRRDGTIRGLR